MQTLKPFEYIEPATVQEAVRISLKYGDKATIIAGGVDLVPRMRLRKLRPEYLVSLQSIPGLDYVESDGKGRRSERFEALVRMSWFSCGVSPPYFSFSNLISSVNDNW